MPFIVLAPSANIVQLGVAKSFPQVILPSAQLPLQPALTFATRLLLVCAQHLSLTKSQLSAYELAVACPSTGLPFDKRCILRHAADLLHIDIRFFAPYYCARTVATRDCTIVHIGFNHTVIFDHCRVEAIAVGLTHMAESVRHAISPDEDGVRLLTTAGVIAHSEQQPLGHLSCRSGTLTAEHRKKAAHVLFGDDDEQNLACAVARFVRDARDVYAREQARWVFCIGEGALPGVMERLKQEFEQCRHRFGVRLELKAVHSDFEGAIVLWVGAAALAVAGFAGDDDEDRIR
ncbi:unnamed protein product [Agarophyton chilense]